MIGLILIAGLIIGAIGFFFSLYLHIKYKSKACEKLMLLFLFSVLACFVVGAIYAMIPGGERTVIEEYDIWYTDTPFGYYWVETDAHGGFFILFGAYTSDSELKESYTIKYLTENDELKTLIFPSNSENHHIYFTEDTENMTFKYYKEETLDRVFGWTTDEEWYEIYIPNPDLIGE